METIQKASVKAHIAQQNYLTQITDGVHHLQADEPWEKGGQDLGMNPFELLASSLAACTSITLRMYAELKQIELKSVEVEVKMYAAEKNEEVKFSREIHLNGDLSPEIQERLLRVANSCPVHKVLMGQVVIETKLV